MWAWHRWCSAKAWSTALCWPMMSSLGLDREAVAAVCRALGDLGASEKLMFWLRDHGALAGKSVAAALQAGAGLAKVERLAAAWARERGASRGAKGSAAAA